MLAYVGFGYEKSIRLFKRRLMLDVEVSGVFECVVLMIYMCMCVYVKGEKSKLKNLFYTIGLEVSADDQAKLPWIAKSDCVVGEGG